MKLIHLTSYFFPEYSGTATRLYNLLRKLPYETLLFTSDRIVNGKLIIKKSEQFGNIKVRRLPIHIGSSKVNIPGLGYLQIIYTYYRKSKKLIEASLGEKSGEKFNIIHAHNVFPLGEAAKKMAKTYHTPFVFELHGMTEESHIGITKFIVNIHLQKETHRLLRTSDHVITLTQSLKDWLCTSYKISIEKVTVVPNGADIDIFASKEEYQREAGNLIKKFNIDGRIVMYAGIMDKINGLSDLANVVPDIIHEKPDTSFVFIGHGPEEDKIIALSKKYPQVKFLPMVPYDDMPIYYQMCDLFVIPRPSTISAETITPLKLLEVMAMEKPVLGSNVGGIAEVIRHAENGYLFEKGNTESFKKTLLEVLDMDNTQIGKNARKTIVENYTWDKSAKILQEVYEDLL